MTNEINIMVGGEAGQGVQSVGFLLAKALTRWGYHIFADQDYESRVRGGHNFFRVRASDSPVEAIDEKVDILIALNKETIDLHRQEIRDGGVIIYDGEKITGLDGEKPLQCARGKTGEGSSRGYSNDQYRGIRRCAGIGRL